jgi:putative N-acetylmannosamine-6-phosphate epimerase
MVGRSVVGFVVAGALVAFSPGTGVAAASKCDSGVTKAEGKKIACKLGVYAKAEQKGEAVDTTKLQKCTDKFTKSCTKAQSAADCSAQTQTCAADEAEADACVTTLSGTTGPASKCDSGITKAVGKKVACKAGVNAKGQQKGIAPDSAKLQKCTDGFTKSCTKAKTANDCSAHPETCAATEASADTCVTTISGSPSGAFVD